MKIRTLLFCLLALAATSLNAQTKYAGGDLSMLTKYEEANVAYYDVNGTKIENGKLLEFLRDDAGFNIVRVRLFVNPTGATGVCQDLEYVKNLGKQIKDAGMAFMLDFHYSDTWADPEKQFTPKTWAQADRRALTDSVYAYTRRTLQAMKKAGVAPQLIQVGNEITNGLLWPTGKLDPTSDENWDTVTDFLKAGCRACREVCPKAQIIIHTEKAGDWDVTKSYYLHLRQYGVDYDIIGLSYYPMWHKSIPNLGKTLDNLAELFPDKPVMIVEAAAYYSHENDPWAKPDQYAEFYPISMEGQAQYTKELVEELNRHHNVTGLFWWFPEENGFGNTVTKGWLNRGLFDNKTGQALPALRELSGFMH